MSFLISNSPPDNVKNTPLDPIEKRARLRLLRSENVGCVSFFQLLKRHGCATEALKHLSDYAQKGGREKSLRLATDQEIEQEIRKTTQNGAHFLFYGEAPYPQNLQHIYDPPPILIYKGQKDLFTRDCLAIVGARNASLLGKKIARNFSMALGQSGWGITSGLARGIDRAAHEGALDTGTIACIAGGIDSIYPQENADLFRKIEEAGLLITESPFGTKPQASLFPRRNRLVSGLSRGILVVEAALKSGSLITARLGLEQGREIFAIPGSPLDPRSQGTNKLIQQGARLVQTPDDILEAFLESPFKTYSANRDAPFSDCTLTEELSSKDKARLQEHLLTTLTVHPIDLDDLFRDCQCSYSDFSLILLELELAGHIIRHPGNQVSRTWEGGELAA